jgi:hypothetical protein
MLYYAFYVYLYIYMTNEILGSGVNI